MSTTAVNPGTYTLDSERTTISFTTKHLFGLGTVKGTFTITSGTVTVGDPLEASSVAVTVAASSFNSANAGRDKAVCSKRFLDVEHYPEFTFSSTALREGPSGWVLIGELAAHGVTAPIELTVGDVRTDGTSIRASATATIDRTHFGITGSKGMAGRTLDITVEAVGQL